MIPSWSAKGTSPQFTRRLVELVFIPVTSVGGALGTVKIFRKESQGYRKERREKQKQSFIFRNLTC